MDQIVSCFDFSQEGKYKYWQLQQGDGLVIKGNVSYDRLGRDLSILGDSKGVAWASNTEAGALIWNGSE